MADVVERRSDLTKTTPMMEQYLSVKAEYEGYILMYRLGDFYECFYEDAVIASRELELTLTSRDCGEGKRAAMCGVPFHKADVYIGRLVERGYKVAICEQTEDPSQKKDKTLVKREVIRVVTPGTVTDASLLSDEKNNFLLSLCYGIAGAALAFADISTGEVFATYVKGDNLTSDIENELAVYQPSEAIINIDEYSIKSIVVFLSGIILYDNVFQLC